MASVLKPNPKDQRLVDSLILCGLIITFTVLPVGFHLMPTSSVKLETAWERVVFTLRWQTLSLLTFIFGFHRVAHLRHSTVAINPVIGNGEKDLEIELRYLQNTFEQLAISACAQLILATYLDDSVKSVIPVLVVYFVVARALFYIGYKKNPLKRALGMSMTFAPNFIVFLYILYCLMKYGPLYGL